MIAAFTSAASRFWNKNKKNFQSDQAEAAKAHIYNNKARKVHTRIWEINKRLHRPCWGCASRLSAYSITTRTPYEHSINGEPRKDRQSTQTPPTTFSFTTSYQQLHKSSFHADRQHGLVLLLFSSNPNFSAAMGSTYVCFSCISLERHCWVVEISLLGIIDDASAALQDMLAQHFSTLTFL